MRTARPEGVTPEAWTQARAIVSGWPTLTDQQNREITTLAVAHRAKVVVASAVEKRAA